MTSQMQHAIDVLDKLSVTDLHSADDVALMKFQETLHHWTMQATKAMIDRAKGQAKP